MIEHLGVSSSGGVPGLEGRQATGGPPPAGGPPHQGGGGGDGRGLGLVPDPPGDRQHGLLVRGDLLAVSRKTSQISSPERGRPGGFSVLSQRHLPGVRADGRRSRGRHPVHEGSLGRRRSRGEVHHLLQQFGSGRHLHLILLANFLHQTMMLLVVILQLVTLWFNRLLFCWNIFTSDASVTPNREILNTRRSTALPEPESRTAFQSHLIY